MITEFWWIQVVYDCFPVLALERVLQSRPSEAETEPEQGVSTRQARRLSRVDKVVEWMARERSDWAEFARLPIFYSELLIPSLYVC